MALTFVSELPLQLECGKQLENVVLAYETYGTYVHGKTRVIWVCHALTANANVAEWWAGLFGAGKILDPEQYFIVCANMLGSCYGSTCPEAVTDYSTEHFENVFPPVSIRDIVNAQMMLKAQLGIEEIFLLLGGSMGGQQAMEWAIAAPATVKFLALLATNAQHSSWGIAFNEAQRMALVSGKNGLEAARAIAMLSYRNYEMYSRTAKANDGVGNYGAANYQRYQGQKLANRFSAESYFVLSKAMDSHNVGRGYPSAEIALAKIKAATLVIGIKTDLLFPVSEQIFLANHIENAKLEIIESPFGHDGFLTESEKINELLKQFIKE